MRGTFGSGVLPRGLLYSGIDAVVGSYDAVVRSTSDYWSSALSQKTGPLQAATDLLTWWSTVLRREPPQWSTEHTVVQQWPIARLRDFSDPGSEADVAVLLLPPQAGHDSCIVDFAPGQSQIRTAKDAGLRRVLSLDWIGATQATKNSTIDDYLAVIDEAIDVCGGTVHLVGDCQGGWLAVIYAALHPERVRTLTIAGAPIDFHAGEPLIQDWLRVLSPHGTLLPFRALVAAHAGVLPGEYLLAGFKALQPGSELNRHLQLGAHLHEQRHVARYDGFARWYEHTQPIAGAFYLWIVQHLFRDNELIAGTLEVGGQKVDLGRIECPLFLLAGAADHITPAPQVYALADYAGTPPSQVVSRLTDGGHLGLFMGHEALRDHWAPTFAALAKLGAG